MLTPNIDCYLLQNLLRENYEGVSELSEFDFFTKYKNLDYHAGGDIVMTSRTLDDNLNRHNTILSTFNC
jgi:predicted aldo/keto reductase-like oxidoreductase